MPKVSPSIPTELVLAKLSDRASLSDDLWLIPPQVGMLIGRSTEQLEDDRKVGNPPPAMKPWGEKGPVRYRLGSIRDFMLGPAGTEYPNTEAARIGIQKLKNAGILGFATVNDWMDGARLDDQWPFLVRAHKPPIDLFKSLGLGDELKDTDRVEWLTLDDYLRLRRDAASTQAAADEEAAIFEESKGNQPAKNEVASGMDGVRHGGL